MEDILETVDDTAKGGVGGKCSGAYQAGGQKRERGRSNTRLVVGNATQGRNELEVDWAI